jgi:hypothetical protein
VAGGLLVLKWLRLVWLHIPAVCWAIWIEYSGSICPLTPLEQSLRQHAGEVSYSGGFIAHYLTPILYPDGLTREMQWWIAAFVLVLNLVVYSLVFIAWKKKKRRNIYQ